MRKGIVALALAALLLALPLCASAKVNADLFDGAKSALSYVSYGEYAKALKALGLPSGKADAKKLKKAVAEGLSSALEGEVQTSVAVCYRSGKGYRLCVPVEDPDLGGVEAFVLLSKDGERFSGYATADWADCAAEAAQSREAVWRDEPRSVDPLIIAD